MTNKYNFYIFVLLLFLSGCTSSLPPEANNKLQGKWRQVKPNEFLYGFSYIIEFKSESFTMTIDKINDTDLFAKDKFVKGKYRVGNKYIYFEGIYTDSAYSDPTADIVQNFTGSAEYELKNDTLILNFPNDVYYGPEEDATHYLVKQK